MLNFFSPFNVLIFLFRGNLQIFKRIFRAYLYVYNMKLLSSSSLLLISIVTISAIAWIVAFAGSISASQSIKFFPKFTWWTLVFQLLVVVGVPICVFLNRMETYKLFLLSCTTIAFIYTSNSVNNIVYYSNSSASAASAGFIIISITNFMWIFYLGCYSSTGDQFFSNKRSISLNKSSQRVNQPQNELTGLENIELNSNSNHHLSVLTVDRAIDEDGFIDAYPILVKGLYDYSASPDDANELSFRKGELLRVENTTGNWWLGRNSNGEVGMCPSNYLEIVN